MIIRSSLKNKLHKNFTPNNSNVIIAVDHTKNKGKSIMKN